MVMKFGGMVPDSTGGPMGGALTPAPTAGPMAGAVTPNPVAPMSDAVSPTSTPTFKDPMPLQFNSQQPSNWAGSVTRIPPPIASSPIPLQPPFQSPRRRRRVAY